MKTTQLILILLIAAFLTIGQEGCESNDSDTNKVDPYIGGTRGLAIEFAAEAPPAEVFDGGTDPFDIELVLNNVGETAIMKENVKVMLEGLYAEDFGKTESDFIKDGINEDIEATYKDFEGNIMNSPSVYITFPGLIFKDSLTGNKQFPIRATVCYNYATEVVGDGCIRKDPRSTEEGVCVVNEEKKVFNSGAPIQVTKFLEQPSGTTTVKYLFTIKHLGSGSIYAPLSKCAQSAENEIKYKIESSVADLLCSGADSTGKQGFFTLRPGQEYVLRCSQEKESQLDFIDRIFLTLEYDYKESVPKDILIKRNI